MEQLEAVDVAQYRYKYEDESAPLRLGLIAEEAPADVLSASGKGVDIYKLVTFTLAGVQELAEKVSKIWEIITSNKHKITALENRITTIESQLAASNGNSITNLVTPLPSTATTTPLDTISPTITINGNNPANINIGDTYSDLGATVTDNVNENLGLKTFLDGILVTQITLNTASTTTYTIAYTATDQAGNTATSTRIVIINDPNE